VAKNRKKQKYEFMKTLAKETLQIVRQNLRNVLLFDFLYRLIVYSAYLRFAKRGLRLALKMAGYSYLTVSNIGRFLIQPWTIVLILLLGSIGIALLMLEAAGLITAYQGSAYGQKLSPLHILWGGLQKVLEEIRRKNVKLCGVLPVQYFLLNLFLIFRILTHLKPMNFVLLEMLRSPWAMGSLAVLGFVCILIAIPTMFIFYGCMIEQKSFSDSLVRSLSLLKHHIFRSAGLLVAGNTGNYLAGSCVYLFCVCGSGIYCEVYGTEPGDSSAFIRIGSIGTAVYFPGRNSDGGGKFWRFISALLPVWQPAIPAEPVGFQLSGEGKC